MDALEDVGELVGPERHDLSDVDRVLKHRGPR
jgi:hypothetical protein